MQVDDTLVFVVIPGNATASAGGELVILQATLGKYYGLNSVGMRVWNLMHTPRSIAHVGAILAAEYNVEEEEARRDVRQLVTDLVVNGLVREVPLPGDSVKR